MRPTPSGPPPRRAIEFLGKAMRSFSISVASLLCAGAPRPAPPTTGVDSWDIVSKPTCSQCRVWGTWQVRKGWMRGISMNNAPIFYLLRSGWCCWWSASRVGRRRALNTLMLPPRVEERGVCSRLMLTRRPRPVLVMPLSGTSTSTDQGARSPRSSSGTVAGARRRVPCGIRRARPDAGAGTVAAGDSRFHRRASMSVTGSGWRSAPREASRRPAHNGGRPIDTFSAASTRPGVRRHYRQAMLSRTAPREHDIHPWVNARRRLRSAKAPQAVAHQDHQVQWSCRWVPAGTSGRQSVSDTLPEQDGRGPPGVGLGALNRGGWLCPTSSRQGQPIRNRDQITGGVVGQFSAHHRQIYPAAHI